jgi:hypothetical protein
MTHGDDRGLRLPPLLAPVQVVIVPIYKSDDERALVLEATKRLVGALGDVRVRVDDREGFRPGFKYNEWELKGVPIRLEIGPKDVAAGQVTLARRDNGNKHPVAENAVPATVAELLDEIQTVLYDEAAAFRDGPSALEDVVRRIFEQVGLLTFFTAGEKETRAWTLRRGQDALEAAESIHSDIAHGFIRAEVIRWNDLVASGSHAEAARRGLQRLEGKTYLVEDGDVLNIRFSPP